MEETREKVNLEEQYARSQSCAYNRLRQSAESDSMERIFGIAYKDSQGSGRDTQHPWTMDGDLSGKPLKEVAQARALRNEMKECGFLSVDIFVLPGTEAEDISWDYVHEHKVSS